MYKELNESICHYLDNKSENYAFMLTGEWGCGKTHYIKKELPRITKDKGLKYLYMSLMGMDDPNTIMTSLLENAFAVNKQFFQKGTAKLVSAGFNVIGHLFNLDALKDLKIDSIGSLLSDFIKLDGFVIIFDDLERANVRASEVLAIINSILENENTKVILVANEEMIRTSKTNITPYNISDLLSEHRMDEYKVKTKWNKDDFSLELLKNDQSIETVTASNLRERAQLLEHLSDNYLDFKEKVVGQVYNLNLDKSQIIKSVLMSNDKDVSDDIVEKAIALYEKNEWNNYRILNRSYNLLTEIKEKYIASIPKVKDNSHELYISLFISILNVCHDRFNNKEDKRWAPGQRVCRHYFGDPALNPMMYTYGEPLTFKFIHDYFYRGIWSEADIKADIELGYKFISNEKLKLTHQDLFDKKDGEVVSILNTIKDEIDKGTHEPDVFQLIIDSTHYLTLFGFENEIEEILISIKNRVEQGFLPNDIISMNTISNDETANSKFNEIINNINTSIKKQENILLQKSIENILCDTQNWGTRLLEYVKSNRDEIDRIMNYIDIQRLIDLIDTSISDWEIYNAELGLSIMVKHMTKSEENKNKINSFISSLNKLEKKGGFSRIRLSVIQRLNGQISFIRQENW